MKKYLRSVLLLFLTAVLATVCYAAKQKEEPIPKIIKVEQIAPNTIKVTYDRQIDEKKGTDLHNYWIQNVTGDTADEIASLGRGDKADSENTLNPDKAQVIAQNNINTDFLIRFKEKIPKGGQYKVIICNITVPDGKPYTGENGQLEFSGK